jgi:hypothetical protein
VFSQEGVAKVNTKLISNTYGFLAGVNITYTDVIKCHENSSPSIQAAINLEKAFDT